MPLKFKALLSDIEGTTTSIDFVKNILFPFAAEHVQQYISQLILSSRKCTHEQIELIGDLINTSNECASLDSTIEKIEQNDEDAMLADKLVKNIRQWIQQDKKLTPLKTLQGLIWEDGYKRGQLKADVYPDVPNVLAKLSQASIPIYIYSSGSVQAQQLLFVHTNLGDLTKYISGYFDTNIGQKMEAESYQKIAAQIGIQPEEILFLTDIEKEAIAAHAAGLQVRLALREGNAPLSAECLTKFQTIRSFEEILQ